ncbi:hypothetical protein PhCBS80983_g00382 [Powellomyces hirtus]|uniref:Uncharacterized protein n=1 Tax=Powellomyces hirtus TaxID=109895 RepID=A0A507EHL6_9FUNG|nr:hypothetical protein PhCBS80983_g00382 [Powellomyces hirtus]
MAKKRTAPSKGAVTKTSAPRDLDLKKAKDSKVQSDMPAKYRTILAAQKFSKANKKEVPKTTSTAPKSTSKFAPRNPGESLGEYNRRIDDSVRASVNAAVQSTSKTRQKKKTWLKVRKQKGSTKSKSEDSADEQERLAAKDDIKFGVVAMQPPSITAIPKQRGGNAAAIAALHKFQAAKAQQQASSDPSDGSDQDDAAARTDSFEPKSIGRKRKLKTLPEVERIAITAARDKAIAHYRAMKGAAGGSTREREDGSDEESD